MATAVTDYLSATITHLAANARRLVPQLPTRSSHDAAIAAHAELTLAMARALYDTQHALAAHLRQDHGHDFSRKVTGPDTPI